MYHYIIFVKPQKAFPNIMAPLKPFTFDTSCVEVCTCFNTPPIHPNPIHICEHTHPYEIKVWNDESSCERVHKDDSEYRFDILRIC